MATDPADRYPSAEAFQEALKRYLFRPKVLAALTGACGLALIAGLVYALIPPPPDRIHSESQTAANYYTPPAPARSRAS